MRRSILNQSGISIAGLLFYLVLVVVALTLVLKLGPHYMEYFEIRSVMQGLTEDPALAAEGRYGIAKSIQHRLTIDYIEAVKRNDFKITKAKEGYQVSMKYDVREHLFANVDVVLTFSYQVVVKSK